MSHVFIVLETGAVVVWCSNVLSVHEFHAQNCLRDFEAYTIFRRCFLVLGFTHGVWLRLADDVSEPFVGSIFKVNCNDSKRMDIRVL